MKKVWKWIIGIVIGLVVVALVVGGVFLVRSHFNFQLANAVHMSRPGVLAPGTGRVPTFGYGDGQDGWTGRGPGMMQTPFGGRGGESFGRMGHMGWMGFGMMPFGGPVGGLFMLGFIALVVLGIIFLVRLLSKPAMVPAAVPVAATHPCKKCAEPVQDGWAYCPHCGKKV